MNRMSRPAVALAMAAFTASGAAAAPPLPDERRPICIVVDKPVGTTVCLPDVIGDDPIVCIYLDRSETPTGGFYTFTVVEEDDEWDCWWCGPLSEVPVVGGSIGLVAYLLAAVQHGEPPKCPPPFWEGEPDQSSP